MIRQLVMRKTRAYQGLPSRLRSTILSSLPGAMSLGCFIGLSDLDLFDVLGLPLRVSQLARDALGEVGGALLVLALEQLVPAEGVGAERVGRGDDGAPLLDVAERAAGGPAAEQHP